VEKPVNPGPSKAPVHPVTVPPSASFYHHSDRLGDEITELCGYIYAASYRLLVLIRAFDQQGLWQLSGLCSCAHWLNFKCGIGMNAAREKLRVAHALAELPRISAAFASGALSYSKVRAMTRVATRENEDYLLMIARHGTAHHMEKLVSKYATCKRLQQEHNASRQQQMRTLSYRYDEDGSLIITGRFPPEQGALILKALERSMERQFREANGPDESDDTAEAPERASYGARRADALLEVAESYLNNGPASGSTAERYQVVVHVSAETLSHINAGLSHLEHGPHVTAETCRRIACDGSIIRLIEDPQGEPLSIGRKTRAIPPAMRRALRARDKGCRFPGCNNTHFIDGHHITHWAHGGETGMDNLLQLCRRHHRLVHEGGFACERQPDGTIAFLDQRGDLLPECFEPVTLSDTDISDWMHSIATELNIDGDTCVPLWCAGDTMDWDLGVAHLFACTENPAPDTLN